MPKLIKKILILTAGVVFLLLGILGLALPFLQEFLFILIGVFLLSFYSPAMHERIMNYARPYPRVHAWMERIVHMQRKFVSLDEHEHK